MGTFDYVRVTVPLPDGYKPKGGLFQTKDFACDCSAVHEIRPDGIWIDDVHTESLAWHEKAYPLAKRHEWRYLAGSMRALHNLQQHSTFSGGVRFYDYDKSTDPSWHEYTAVFLDGALIAIRLGGHD